MEIVLKATFRQSDIYKALLPWEKSISNSSLVTRYIHGILFVDNKYYVNKK